MLLQCACMCVCACGCVRKRTRELTSEKFYRRIGQSAACRIPGRHTHIHTNTHTNTQTDRQTHTHTHTHTYALSHTPAHEHTLCGIYTLQHTATHCNTLQNWLLRNRTHAYSRRYPSQRCVVRTQGGCWSWRKTWKNKKWISSLFCLTPAAFRCTHTICVAVCCSVLQCVAVCCGELQCLAVCRTESTAHQTK